MMMMMTMFMMAVVVVKCHRSNFKLTVCFAH